MSAWLEALDHLGKGDVMCMPFRTWARRQPSAVLAWNSCAYPDGMLWLLCGLARHHGAGSRQHKRAVLALVTIARKMLARSTWPKADFDFWKGQRRTIGFYLGSVEAWCLFDARNRPNPYDACLHTLRMIAAQLSLRLSAYKATDKISSRVYAPMLMLHNAAITACHAIELAHDVGWNSYYVSTAQITCPTQVELAAIIASTVHGYTVGAELRSMVTPVTQSPRSKRKAA